MNIIKIINLQVVYISLIILFLHTDANTEFSLRSCKNIYFVSFAVLSNIYKNGGNKVGITMSRSN